MASPKRKAETPAEDEAARKPQQPGQNSARDEMASSHFFMGTVIQLNLALSAHPGISAIKILPDDERQGLSVDAMTNLTILMRDKKYCITSLNLSGCSIQSDDDVVALLSTLIKTNTTITSLNLSRNDILAADTFAEIADALKVNKTITHLDLSGNDLDHDHSDQIGELIKANSTITHLGLSGNAFDTDAISPIIKALSTNETIVELGLGPSKLYIEPVVLEAIGVIVEKNKVWSERKAELKATLMRSMFP